MNLDGMIFTERSGWRLVFNMHKLRSDAKRKEEFSGLVRLGGHRKGAVTIENKFFKKVYFDQCDFRELPSGNRV